DGYVRLDGQQRSGAALGQVARAPGPSADHEADCARVVGPQLEIREEHRVGPSVGVDGDKRQRGPQAPGEVTLREAADEGGRERFSEGAGHAILVRESLGSVKALTTH